MTETTQTLKLQAYLAQSGVTSRRKAEALIAAGQVTVNGHAAHIGQRINPATDKINVQGQVVTAATDKVYFLVNKPKGLISTTSDELNRTTVLSLVPTSEHRLYPVGRLDKDSEGLMLLTNDGDVSYYLTHPKHEVTKTYRVRVTTEPTELALEHLRRGVKLDRGYTRPAEVQIVASDALGTWLEITIHEGKQHQVRRMMRRVGYEVERLIRVQLGPFTLKMLHGKKYRALTPQEVEKYLASYKQDSHTTPARF